MTKDTTITGLEFHLNAILNEQLLKGNKLTNSNLIAEYVNEYLKKVPETTGLPDEKILEYLEDRFEECFDKNTYPTGGGYEADTTDRNGLFHDFKPHIQDALNQKDNEIKRLREVLTRINQMSDPGSYEKAIIDMKQIATTALKGE